MHTVAGVLFAWWLVLSIPRFGVEIVGPLASFQECKILGTKLREDLRSEFGEAVRFTCENSSEL